MKTPLTRRARVIAVTLATLCLTRVVPAQIVTGRVTDRATAVPVPGALVSLVVGEKTVVSVLTDDRGTYAVRAADPGTYRLSVKRIGARRWTGEPFAIGAGETLTRQIAIELIPFELAAIRVDATTPCLTRPTDGPQMAAIWDDVRSALTATQVSLRDRLFRGTVVRYIRELDPVNLAIRSEELSRAQGVMERPFVAIGADSLSRLGYVIRLPDDIWLYNAPDANVLLAESFVADHCFRLRREPKLHPGVVGMSFEPTDERRLPDIAGTMWLDEKTSELRFVEYRYTNVPNGVENEYVGGEVHFTKLPNGAWIVTRWFIRMPQRARPMTPVTTSGQTPSVMVRSVLYSLREEGGRVSAEGLYATSGFAAVGGVVRETPGPRGLAGAFVQLTGTQHAAVADSLGAWKIDSILPGTYAIRVTHPRYDSLGVLVSEAPVALTAGQLKSVTASAPSSADVRRQLCGSDVGRKNSILRVVVADGYGKPVGRGRDVAIVWQEFQRFGTEGLASKKTGKRATTDVRGAAYFCDVPSDRTFVVRIVDEATGREQDSAPLKLLEGQVLGVVIAERR